ncbi:SP0191 family lipoprotein [Streptococcus rubneri]|jgi:hypothetical protein|uniref:SP0191 family lipoprotein n=1 Tax=Streptococcus rubneri TaxID=1234680 RepID=UPI00189FBBCD|nr:SP0191 family lipoprotein [Streptococcus rubneri]
MKKKLMYLGLVLVALTACGQKKQGKTNSSSNQKANSAKIEQFNKENRNVLEKAEDQQIYTKTFAMPKDEKGIQQTQMITYQGDSFTKLVMVNTIPTSDEIKQAIQQAGIEEVQKLLVESMDKDEAAKQARALPGFSLEIKLLNENDYQTTITYDFTTLDVKKAAAMEYFKSSNLEALLKLTPTQYMNNLLRNGAKEQS